MIFVRSTHLPLLLPFPSIGRIAGLGQVEPEPDSHAMCSLSPLLFAHVNRACPTPPPPPRPSSEFINVEFFFWTPAIPNIFGLTSDLDSMTANICICIYIDILCLLRGLGNGIFDFPPPLLCRHSSIQFLLDGQNV